MRRQRGLIIWIAFLAAVWILLNLPHSPPLKSFLYSAGFPWTFAGWVEREASSLDFDILMLLADFALGLLVVLIGAVLFVWAKRLDHVEPKE